MVDHYPEGNFVAKLDFSSEWRLAGNSRELTEKRIRAITMLQVRACRMRTASKRDR